MGTARADDGVWEPSAWTMWLAQRSRWWRGAGYVAVGAPSAVALSRAMFPDMPVPLIGPIIICAYAAMVVVKGRSRDRLLATLTSDVRRRVLRTQLTGVSDGNPQVDQAAAYLLTRRPLDRSAVIRAFLIGLLVLLAALYVVAAVRDDLRWLAVGAITLGGLAVVALPLLHHHHASALARLSSDRSKPAFPAGTDSDQPGGE